MGQIIDVPGMGKVEFPDGMTDDQIVAAIKANPPAEKPSGVDKALKVADRVADKVNTGVNWLGTQFTKGATGLLGMPDTLGTLAEKTGEWAGTKVGAPKMGKGVGSAIKKQLTFHGAAPSTEGMNEFVFGSLGVPEVNAGDNPAFTLTKPFGLDGKVNVGKMLDVGAQAIPGMIAGPGGVAAKVVPGFLGGVGSEAAGQATAGGPWELPARIMGGVAGGMAGAKMVTPFKANLTPNEARAVAIAKERGVPLTVGQETGRGRKVESALARFPTSAGPFNKLAAKQGAAADRTTLSEMGFVGDDVGLETMKAAGRQAGAEFKAATEMPGTVSLTPKFFDKAKGAVADYQASTPPSELAPSVGANLKNFTKLEPGQAKRATLTATAVAPPTPTLQRIKEAIIDADLPPSSAKPSRNDGALASWFGEGPKVPMPKRPPELTNEKFQAFRKALSDTTSDLYTGGKPAAAKALQKVRDALDDAAGASLPAEQMEAWKTARRHYYNFKIIEKAAAGGTVASRSTGTLSPNALTAALKRKQGDAFSRTTGGLNDVASLKQYLADTFPNSGTPTMQAYQGLISGGAGLGAAGLTGAAGVGVLSPSVAIPAAAALAAPNLMARAMTGGGRISGPIRNWLANQQLADPRQTIANVPLSLAPGIALAAPGYPRLERRQ